MPEKKKSINPQRQLFKKTNREIFSKSHLNEMHKITRIGSRNKNLNRSMSQEKNRKDTHKTILCSPGDFMGKFLPSLQRKK